MEVSEHQKKIVVGHPEYKMEMAEGRFTPSADKSEQLEKIWQLNLLARDVLLKSDKEERVEYVLRLSSSTRELSGSLSQHLGNIIENLQDTCHLLSVLHDKHKELAASPGKYKATSPQREWTGCIRC